MEIKSFIVTIVSTVVLNEILLLILPDGNLKKYIKMVCAIVILIIIISPMISFFKGNSIEINLKNILNKFEQSYIENNDIDIYKNYVDQIYERNSYFSE